MNNKYAEKLYANATKNFKEHERFFVMVSEMSRKSKELKAAEIRSNSVRAVILCTIFEYKCETERCVFRTSVSARLIESHTTYNFLQLMYGSEAGET